MDTPAVPPKPPSTEPKGRGLPRPLHWKWVNGRHQDLEHMTEVQVLFAAGGYYWKSTTDVWKNASYIEKQDCSLFYFETALEAMHDAELFFTGRWASRSDSGE